MPKNYNAVSGQSIYDVCLNTYGTLDNLVKLLRDNGSQGVNDIPASGQLYEFDDTLVVDQRVNQATTLSGILYATLAGTNGSYYIINQDKPPVILPPSGGGPTPPPKPGDMGFVIGQTQFTSSADGTTVLTPVDADGLSMIGYDIVGLEKEIRPVDNIPAPNQRWAWSKSTGVLTLLNGEALDNGQTLFILYSKPI